MVSLEQNAEQLKVKDKAVLIEAWADLYGSKRSRLIEFPDSLYMKVGDKSFVSVAEFKYF
jgi:hypothetical protein